MITPVTARLARPLAEGRRNRVVVGHTTASRLIPQRLLTACESIRVADPDWVFDVLMRLGGRMGWLRYNRYGA